jgi:hypothetical protein
LVLVLVLVVAGIVCAVILLDGGAPPPVDDIADQNAAVEALKSADFSKLSEEDKVAYAEKLRELRPWELMRPGRGGDGEGEDSTPELTEEERKSMRENARTLFHAALNDRVQGYFGTPEEDRTAYLDKLIDDMQQRRKEMEQRRSSEGEGGTTPGGRDRDGEGRREEDGTDRRERGMARMKNRIETTDPEERAQFVEFMKQMRARMEERGIEAPRFGPGRSR